ncbi:MAG: MFS transporter [Terricaulis sp.]|nr:MFS transporter [Terricaulis sp.]
MAFVALVGPIARVLGMAPWQAGASVTAAGVLWMALAPVWGRLSDRTGRRKVLLIGVGGFAAAYAGLCLFVEIALILLPGALIAFIGMLIGRAVIGAFYAAVPPASFALIADHAPQDKRAAMMARLGAAQASGMVIGPAAAGLLAQWSLSLPLFATALFACGRAGAALVCAAARNAAPRRARRPQTRPFGSPPAAPDGDGVLRDVRCLLRASGGGLFRAGSAWA